MHTSTYTTKHGILSFSLLLLLSSTAAQPHPGPPLGASSSSSSAAAQPHPGPPLGASSSSSYSSSSAPADDPYSNTHFSTWMGIILIVLIAVLFAMAFLSIYLRHCSSHFSSSSSPATGNRLVPVAGRSVRAPRGLDADVIRRFPTFKYADVEELKLGKGTLECAICLNEFQGDETLRLIPKCDHVFHVDCVDTWLGAHTTCPVCRSNLGDITGESATELGYVSGMDPCRNDVVVVVDSESMEQPLQSEGSVDSSGSLNRNRTRKDIFRNLSGRSRWFGKFSRSFSTGHVAVKQWENFDRFTLKLPEEVRRQIMTGKLERSTSLVVLPRQTSSKRGYRTGFRPDDSDRTGTQFSQSFRRSDWWVLSLVPPFFSRGPSRGAGTSRQGSVGSNREAVVEKARSMLAK